MNFLLIWLKKENRREAQKIIKYLEKKFSPKLEADWDNSGVQIYQKQLPNLSEPINKVLVCLDLNQKVVDYAIEHHFELIITRHPLVFASLVVEAKQKKLLFDKLKSNNILVFSIHTNYDASPNQNLLKIVGEKLPILKNKRFGQDNEGYYLRLKQAVKLPDFIQALQDIFPNSSMQMNPIAATQGLVEEFYLIPGAGGSALTSLKLTNTLLVTGEVKWNELISALDANNGVILLGHYMEEYFVDDLVWLLTNAFENELVVEGFDIKNQLINIERGK